MLKQLAASVALVLAGHVGGHAAQFCDCCAGTLSTACKAVCPAPAETGEQCPVVVDFTGEEEIGPGRNPLYELSFRTLRLQNPSREQREAFRTLLERARQAAEADRATAERDRLAGRISTSEAAQRASRYDNAMINYYLGQQAYRTTRQD